MLAIRRIGKNTISLVTMMLLTNLFIAVFTLFAIRFWGPEKFGEYSLVLAFNTFLMNFAVLGLDSIIKRDISRDKTLSKKYMENIFSITLILSLLVIGAMIGLIKLLDYPEALSRLILLYSLTVIFNSLLVVLLGLVNAYERMEVTATITILSVLLFSIGGFWLISEGYGVDIVLYYGVLISFLTLICTYLVVNRYFVDFLPRIDIGFCKELVRMSLPYGIFTIFFVVHTKIDIFFLSKLMDVKAVGLYVPPIKVITFFGLLLASFKSSIFPLMSRLYQTSRERFMLMLEQISRMFIILTLPLSIILTFYSAEIVLLLFGPEYAESSGVLVIGCWAFLLWGIADIVYIAPLNSNKMARFLPYELFYVVLNASLNLILIPKFGIVGAVFGTLIVMVISLLVDIMLIKHYLSMSFNLFRLLPRPIVAGIAMSVPYILIEHGTLSALASLFTYALALVFTKEVGRGDINTIFELVGVKTVSSKNEG